MSAPGAKKVKDILHPLGAFPLWSVRGRSARQYISAHIPGAGSRSGLGSLRGLYGDPPYFYPEGGFSTDYR